MNECNLNSIINNNCLVKRYSQKFYLNLQFITFLNHSHMSGPMHVPQHASPEKDLESNILTYKILYSFQKFDIHSKFVGIHLHVVYTICDTLRQWLLPNKTSNDHDIWYTVVSFSSLEVFSKFLKKFNFKTQYRQKRVIMRHKNVNYISPSVYT